MIGDGYWTRRFGRDPKVIGRTIVIEQTPYEIVGVTPPEFFGLQVGQRVDVTVPMEAESLRRGWRSMPLIVRLPPDGSPDAATSELTTMFRRFVDGPNPMGFGQPIAPAEKDARFKFVALQPLTSGLGALREQFMRPAVALMVLVAVMLLLACANWATLATAKASARRRDLTICLALGSTRGQLARSMFIESLLLAMAGGIAGFLASWWAVALLVRYLPTYGQPIDLRVDPDLRVLGFTLAMSLATGLVFGLAPAWLTGRIAASELRTAGATDDRRTLGLSRSLVVFQVALTFVLVVAATFFAATLRNLRDRDLGFRDGRVVTFNLDADGTDLEGEALTVVHRQILDRLRSLPGVDRVTLSTIPPLSGNNDGKPLSIPGFVPKAPGDMAAQVNTVGPDYLETFGIRLLRGRTIGAADGAGAPRVALVSQGAARHFFPGVDAIGRTIEIRGATTTQVEIVGVVADVHDRDVRTEAARMFYVPFFQRRAEGEYTFAVRAAIPPGELMRLIRRELRAIVPQIPVPAAQTLSQRLDERLGNERLLSSVAALFGGLALLLAGVGIYGLVAYGVARRTPEIGLRLALGASRSHVVWLVTRNTDPLVSLGVLLGLGVAVASRDLVTSLLFGLPASDARVYAMAVGVPRARRRAGERTACVARDPPRSGDDAAPRVSSRRRAR